MVRGYIHLELEEYIHRLLYVLSTTFRFNIPTMIITLGAVLGVILSLQFLGTTILILFGVNFSVGHIQGLIVIFIIFFSAAISLFILGGILSYLIWFRPLVLGQFVKNCFLCCRFDNCTIIRKIVIPYSSDCTKHKKGIKFRMFWVLFDFFLSAKNITGLTNMASAKKQIDKFQKIMEEFQLILKGEELWR